MAPPSCSEIAHAAIGPPAKTIGAEEYFHCVNWKQHRNGDAHPSLQVNDRKNVFLCGPCSANGGPWKLAAFLGGFDPSEKTQDYCLAAGAWITCVDWQKRAPRKSDRRMAVRIYFRDGSSQVTVRQVE